MGMGFGIAVGIGATVGSGILRTPGEVAAQLRSAWLVLAVWTLGGAYAFFGTACVTELATMLPQEGGWYVYARKAFGEYAGFVVGCFDWRMQTVTCQTYKSSAASMASAGYETASLQSYVSSDGTHFPHPALGKDARLINEACDTVCNS